MIHPRTPADSLAEAKSEQSWVQREIDHFMIGRRRGRRLEALRRDVTANAEIVLEVAGDRVTAAAWAREWAGTSGSEQVPTGEAAAYFWALVACELEDGAR